MADGWWCATALAAARQDLAVMLGDPAIPAAVKNAKLITAAHKNITQAEKALAAAEAAHDAIPARLPANLIDPDAKIALLRTRRRGLQMVLRLLAHNAEDWLASHLNAYLHDDDGPLLTRISAQEVRGNVPIDCCGG